MVSPYGMWFNDTSPKENFIVIINSIDIAKYFEEKFFDQFLSIEKVKEV